MASRVLTPEAVRLEISQGDWLLVKKRLSAGDQQDGFERAYLKHPDGSYVVSGEGKRVVSPAAVRLSLITSYLVDWSFTGLDGKPLDIRGQGVQIVEAMLRMLDTETFREVHDAIDAHDTKEAEARAALKKTLSGENASNGISASPSEQDGATSGSENSTATSTKY